VRAVPRGGRETTDPSLGTSCSPLDGGEARSGGALRDKLLGGRGPDVLFGLGGRDVLWGDLIPGSGAPDQRFGGDDGDTIYGGGPDLVDRGAGNDYLQDDDGADVIDGGPRADHIHTDSGRDRVQAGAGNDTIELLVAGADSIDCGPGRDSVRVDGVDRLRNCERVSRAWRRGPGRTSRQAADQP